MNGRNNIRKGGCAYNPCIIILRMLPGTSSMYDRIDLPYGTFTRL